MLRLIRIAVCLFLALTTTSAFGAEEKDSGDAEAAEGEDAGDDAPAAQPSMGLECSPAVSEVETRRPIPISCAAANDKVTRVEIRYRSPGKKKYTKLNLRKIADEWVGEIPCRATAKRGTFKVSFTGRDAKNNIVARIPPIEIALVTATNEPPPSLPGREAPMRCYDAGSCPPEFRGSPACPGTKATPGARAWGASCAKAKECQTGLACISGTCETPPKCEANEDCASNECSGGVCQFPDEEELASRLGPPKYNWIGLHFGVDMMLTREAVGVCGNETEDSKNFSCYQGGNEYDGSALNRNLGNKFPATFKLATMRALLSYERWFGRLSAGARVGWAFGGAPKDFTPIHLEARVQYALRRDVLNKRGRPYLGLAFGLAQADPKEKIQVVDCSGAPNVEACRAASTGTDPAVAVPGVTAPELDAYRTGSKFFFGPTFGYILAFTNESALSFNVNVMFPDLVLEPALGYVMGL